MVKLFQFGFLRLFRTSSQSSIFIQNIMCLCKSNIWLYVCIIGCKYESELAHTHTHTHTQTNTNTNKTHKHTHVSEDTVHSQWITWEKHVEHLVKEQNKLQQLNLHFLLSTLCRAHSYSSRVTSRHSPLFIMQLSMTFLIIVNFFSLSLSFSWGVEPYVPK